MTVRHRIAARVALALTLLSVQRPARAAYWEEFPPTSGWTQITQVIRPDNTPGRSGQAPPSYFYAINFGFQNDGGCGGYTGLQIDTANNPAPRKVIFSIWCALGAQSTGIAGPFSGEGEGYQTLIPYPWVGGHEYAFTVRRTTPTAAEWSSYVTDLTAGSPETWIGTIQVPIQFGGLQGYTSNFVEWYGAHPSSCQDQPYAAVHFDQPVAATPPATHPIPLDAGTLNTGYGTGACPIPPAPAEAAEGQGVYFVTGTEPVCGNGIRDGAEECDAGDDAACPGRCDMCACQVTVPPPSPRSYWPFEESSGPVAVDASGHGHDGTISGATRVAGRFGGGLEFDGTNDFVDFHTGAALDGPTDFTIAMWVRLAPGSDGGVLLGQRDGSPAGYQGEYALAVDGTGRLRFFIYRDGFQFDLSATSNLADGAWHHVAAVREGVRGHLFVDGDRVAVVAGGTITHLAGTINVYAGADRRDGTSYLGGTLDDLSIYDVALHAADVARLVGAELPLTVAGRSLTMRERIGTPSSRTLSYEARTRPADGQHRVILPAAFGSGDPRIGGGLIHVYNSAGSSDAVSVVLPSAGWRLMGTAQNPKRWRYRALSSSEPIRSLTVQPDRIIFTAKGATFGYSLNEPTQGRIAVRVALGSQRAWCTDMPAKLPVARNDKPGVFVGQAAAAPVFCPPVP